MDDALVVSGLQRVSDLAGDGQGFGRRRRQNLQRPDRILHSDRAELLRPQAEFPLQEEDRARGQLTPFIARVFAAMNVSI
jgi:hypothetical protein